MQVEQTGIGCQQIQLLNLLHFKLLERLQENMNAHHSGRFVSTALPATSTTAHTVPPEDISSLLLLTNK